MVLSILSCQICQTLDQFVSRIYPTCLKDELGRLNVLSRNCPICLEDELSCNYNLFVSHVSVVNVSFFNKQLSIAASYFYVHLPNEVNCYIVNFLDIVYCCV